MDSRTRQLLSIVAGDAAQRVVAGLRLKPQTNAELKASTGLGGTAVDHLLALLLAYGVLDYEVERSDQPGRPSRRWTVAGDAALKKLESAAVEAVRQLGT